MKLFKSLSIGLRGCEKKSVKWRQDGDNFFLTTLIKYVKMVTFCLGHACRGFLVLGE